RRGRRPAARRPAARSAARLRSDHAARCGARARRFARGGRARGDRRGDRSPRPRCRGGRAARAPRGVEREPRSDRDERAVTAPIARVDVFTYRLTYVHGTYAMSGGRDISELESVVVRVTTEDGMEGFGEVCPLGPPYLPGHARGACAALDRKSVV